MKHLLLIVLMSVSMTLFAQPADDAEETDKETEQPVHVDRDYDETSALESDEAGPSDSDFKPDEEISEDFPVPLPSDI